MSKLFISLLIGAAVCCAAPSEKSAKKSDEAFLSMAAEADMTIAHIGKEAEDRGANEKIKDFGKTLVQDHTSDYESLTELASKTGDAIPKGIDRADYRTAAAMEHYKGKTFDHAFLTNESAEHQKLVHAFKEEAAHGANPAIKAYATKALPTIEKHLHDAQDLLKQSI
jgi:putative membrane protein